MRRTSYSLGLIIAFNVLIIGISLVYGLHIIPFPESSKSLVADLKDEYRDLSIKKAD